MSSIRQPFRLPHLLLLVAAILLPHFASAQEPVRFLFILRNPLPGQEPLLINKVLLNGGVPREQINFPELDFIAQVAEFPLPFVIADNDPQVEVVRDVLVYSSSGPLGSGWVKNQFQQPAASSACNDVPPVIYMVDTGISSAHTEFTWPPGSTPALTFQPGWSYAKNTLTNTPLPEYPDIHDHGTRITGCIGGRTTGLLESLGGRAVVKSVAIFDTPSPGNVLATWASQAINGILRSITDHRSRRTLPYLKSRASVLVFAHATRLVDGRFAALDSTIEKAWLAGMHVVMSAGNEGVNAALVSPAGAAWGHVLPPNLPVRFWSGALPPGSMVYRASPEFTVAGGYHLAGGVPAIWPQSNINIGPAAAVDGFGPAGNIPCASSVVPAYVPGSGTSYAAGFAAAMLTWEAWMRPWATPAQARTWLNNSMVMQPGGWMKLETPSLPAAGLTWAEWIEAFYPAVLSTPAQRDPSGDPDGDGAVNFVEYFTGGDPRLAEFDRDPLITVQHGSTITAKVKLPLACHLPPSSQVSWILEQSTDLNMWTTVTTSAVTRLSPPQIKGDGTMAETSATLPAGPRRMLRVKFTFTP